VGAARFLQLLATRVDPSELVAIVNVGDDVTMHGLTVCPDIDTIIYTLSGLHNDELGWGLRGESWRTMDALAALGGDTWFRLGDLDLATHLYRTARLARGDRKTDITRDLARTRGLGLSVLPITDDPLATMIDSEIGRLSFQEYFVRERHSVVARGIHFEGDSHITPEAREALETAERIFIAPSNPLLSIDPLLAVRGVREIIEAKRAVTTAISPLIGGAAVKGPADRLMAELGHRADCVGVAELYSTLCSTMVIDRVDQDKADAVLAHCDRVVVSGTIMSDPAQGHELLDQLGL
jgi:LPPG:FO 2-phospho-L-lactate transferase